jgi:hypothetical protein
MQLLLDRGHIIWNLPDYLNLFSFIVNPPNDPYKKIELILNRVFENPVSLSYREKYSR